MGLAGFLVVGTVKLGVRKSRYLTRDPRRLAAACRRELVDFVADQGVVVPRSATLEDVAEIVRLRLAVDARAFVRAANASRYAPLGEAQPAMRQARRELRRVLRQIRKRSGVMRRARGTVSLRSLTA